MPTLGPFLTRKTGPEMIHVGVMILDLFQTVLEWIIRDASVYHFMYNKFCAMRSLK